MKSGRKLRQQIQIKEPKRSESSAKPILIQEKIVDNVESEDESKQIKKNSRFPDQQQSFEQEQGSQVDVQMSKISSIQKNQEDSKISQMNHNISSLSFNVSQLKDQYNNLKKQEIQLLASSRKSPSNGKDDPKIKRFLKNKQKQKQKLAELVKKDLERSQLRKSKTMESQLQNKKMEQQKKAQQIRKYSSSLAERIQQSKRIQKAKQKQAEQIFSKYKNKTPLFEIKQKQSFQKQVERTEKIKEYLKSYKKKNVFQNQKQIQEFQKKHDQTLQRLEKQKNEQKTAIFKKIMEQNAKMKNIYRSKAGQLLTSEQIQRSQSKMNPFQVRQKIKSYQQHVKNNYKPKKSLKNSRISSGSSLQLLQSKRKNMSINHSFTQVKRYKYMKGFCYGEVIEQRPQAKSLQQERKIGKGYLEYMKSLPKKKPIVTDSHFQIPLIKSPKHNPLQHTRRRNPIVNLNQQPTRQQINMVLNQLKNYDKKIQDKQKIAIKGRSGLEVNQIQRKQINDDILYNVEKKLNLLHKLEDDKTKGSRQGSNDSEYNY